MSTVKLDEGKYEISMDDKNGAMTFYRNGEAWSGAQEAFEHAGVVLALVQRVVDLEAALQTILATKPQHGMNPRAIVGSPHAIGWNVHDIAREVLK